MDARLTLPLPRECKSTRRITISSALNLAYKQWGTVFPGAACVAALVDRFAQHCHLVDIDADSWRHKEATERAASKDPKKSH